MGSCKLATRRVGVSCNHRNMERYTSGVLLVLVVRTVLVSGQLVGHRGLVSLPPDWVYHDKLTLTVSKSAGKLAKLLEVTEKHRESERKVQQLQGRESDCATVRPA